jgi:lysozyme family protein
MPTVPIIDAPTQQLEAGGMQPFAAPGVEPVKNYAAEQAVKLGQATQGAGQAMIKVADQIQDQIDDANTKAADSFFTSRAQKVLMDKDSGYLNSIGLKAKEGYDPTKDELLKARKEAEANLTTDTQRNMFAMVANKHMVNFKSQMDNHAVKQIRVYAAGESEAREKNYVDMAIADPVNRATYTATAVGEANERADLFQLPADSAQRKAMVQAAYQSVHVGVTNDMMNNNKFTEAKAYLDKAYKDEQVDSKTYNTLTRQLDGGYRKQKATITGDAIFQNGQGPTTSDAASVIDYVINKHEGGYVADDAGAGPTKYGINGKANGLSPKQVENLTLDDAREIYRKKYWNAIDAEKLDPSIRAMAFDTAVNQGVGTAKRLLEKSGGDVTKFAELRREEYSNLVASNPGKYQKYEKGWMGRVDDFENAAKGKTQSLSGMLAQADQIPDPEDREMARSRIKNRWAENEAITAQDYQEKVRKAQDIAFASEGGWVNVPPQIWGDLKQSDRAAIMNRPKSSDSNTLLMLQSNPELWAPGKIEKYRPVLSESDYRQFVAKGSGPDGAQKILAATIDQEQMKDGLLKAGLKDLINPKKGSKDEEERITLNARFEKEINQEQIARKRQLSLDEKNALLVRMLKPVKVKAVSSWWSGNTMDKKYYQVETKGNVIVPDETKAAIIKGFESRGIRYNNDMVIDAYLATQEK